MRTKTVEIAAVSFRGDLLPKEKMDIESDCIIASRFWVFVSFLRVIPSLLSTILYHFSVFHCVKSVRIRSYSDPYFTAFGLNTERYGVYLHIQSACGKIPTRITPNKGTFHSVFIFCYYFILLHACDDIARHFMYHKPGFEIYSRF